MRKAAVATFVKHGYDGTNHGSDRQSGGHHAANAVRALSRQTRGFRRRYSLGAHPQDASAKSPEEFDDVELREALVAVGRAGLARAIDPDIVRLKRIAMNESARFPEFAVSALLDDLVGAPPAGDGLATAPPGAPRAIEIEDLELAAGYFIAMVEHLPARLADTVFTAVPRTRSATCSTRSICSFAASCDATELG